MIIKLGNFLDDLIEEFIYDWNKFHTVFGKSYVEYICFSVSNQEIKKILFGCASNKILHFKLNKSSLYYL